MNLTHPPEPDPVNRHAAITPWLDAERRRSLPRTWRRWCRPLLAAVAGLVVCGLWWLDMRGAAAALAGATGLAVAFVVGIAVIRRLLIGSHGVIAVARALVEEAAGSRLPAVIVLLVVLGLPILPLLLDPSERMLYDHEFEKEAFYASPVLAGNKLYLLGNKGVMHIHDTGREYKEQTQGKIDDMCYASPAVVDGMIVIRGINNLWCIKANP